ncbi:MAG: hypothetical protein P4N59_13200 [Negativicutes bacterium]|nr:hypothetical protein [Negativicutes bacterium]
MKAVIRLTKAWEIGGLEDPWRCEITLPMPSSGVMPLTFVGTGETDKLALIDAIYKARVHATYIRESVKEIEI